MSVFTRVTAEELSAWLKRYAIGTLVDLQGIAAGIENTNYFVTTTHGRFVLTLLEKPRGPRWWGAAAREIAPFLDEARRELLASELEFQARHRALDLPRGPVHADLFRDNVLFEGDRIGGVIDFYFAGIDTLLFDVAVAVNDWCVDPAGEIDGARAGALLGAYRRAREFTRVEQQAWPVLLRAAALRFWLSRLYDFYLPRAGELTHAHDPEHFRRVLEARRTRPFPLV